MRNDIKQWLYDAKVMTKGYIVHVSLTIYPHLHLVTI